jgi:hypothetical protein
VFKNEEPGPRGGAARNVCCFLAATDLFLGSASFLAPRLVLRLLAPGQEPEGEVLMRRTGALWLFFLAVQVWAALHPDRPRALRAVAVLRLQEVPADPVWLAGGKGFGLFGRLGIASAPLVNLASGLYLWHAANRLEGA